MGISIDVLKTVAEDIESAVDTLRGFAAITEFRAVLDLDDEGVRLVVTVPSGVGSPEVEVTPIPEKTKEKDA